MNLYLSDTLSRAHGICYLYVSETMGDILGHPGPYRILIDKNAHLAFLISCGNDTTFPIASKGSVLINLFAWYLVENYLKNGSRDRNQSSFCIEFLQLLRAQIQKQALANDYILRWAQINTELGMEGYQHYIDAISSIQKQTIDIRNFDHLAFYEKEGRHQCGVAHAFFGNTPLILSKEPFEKLMGNEISQTIQTLDDAIQCLPFYGGIETEDLFCDAMVGAHIEESEVILPDDLYAHYSKYLLCNDLVEEDSNDLPVNNDDLDEQLPLGYTESDDGSHSVFVQFNLRKCRMEHFIDDQLRYCEARQDPQEFSKMLDTYSFEDMISDILALANLESETNYYQIDPQ